jgi:glycerol-3-phosphate acyltransferase PlsY
MDAQLNSIVPMFLFALLSLFKHRENIKLILSHQETSVYDVLKKKK